MKKRWALLLACLLALCLCAAACAEDAPLYVRNVVVNSYIAQPYNGADFEPENLVDGQSDTCWQVRVRNGMKLEDVYVDLVLEKPSDVSQVWIKNGFWRITDGFNQYLRNSRVKTLGISVLTEGASDFTEPVSFDLPDLPHWKDKKLPDSDWLRFDLTGAQRVVTVRLTVQAIYRGAKYPDDIAISEVQVMGRIADYTDYTIGFVDQDNQPVPDVTIILLSAAGTQSLTSDANGQIIFSGAPDTYRFFFNKLPDGYQADLLQGFELPQEGGALQVTLTRQ